MKKSSSVISAILMVAILVVSLCACSMSQTKINSLNFISATGDAQNTNCLFASSYATSFMENGTYNVSNLQSESALQLIKEIEAIPDPANAQGPLAFKIELVYTDEKAQVHEVKKTGYGAFPANWDTVVKLVNDITENRAGITASKDIVTIDADYILANYDISDDVLPEDVTVEDLVRDIPITYDKLYDPAEPFDLDKAIYDFTDSYYDISSHKLYKFMPSASTTAEMQAFADHRLDSVESTTTMSATGKLGEYVFEIYKYDEFQTYISNSEYADLITTTDGSLRYTYSDEEKTQELDVYVDSSNRFIVLTDCQDLNTIYKVIK